MNKTKAPELLAPAGNWNSLVAAIEAGCDAVYLSGKLYGARSYAGNFSNDELIEAIKYAHLYDVKVYVTTNTIIYEAEVDGFIKYIEFLYENNVDAIIIQDLGMMDLIRKKYPDLELHASTQMHIHNLESVKLMEKLNIKRVVLARETPISLIKEIKSNSNIELEIFCHGALCISYSGQCLMSSLIGGRSGNRGTCAQSCRQKYTLESNNKKVKEGYLLSTKDLNTLEHINELIDSGVDSLKIEGRMKRPEYVYLVVSIYRRVIDEYVKSGNLISITEDLEELKKIFNRKFTKGFLFNENNDNFINDFRPNHMGVTIGHVLNSENGKVKIKLKNDLYINDGIRFLTDSDDGFTVTKIFKNGEKVNKAFKGDIIELLFNGTKLKRETEVIKTTDYNQLLHINKLINNHSRKVLIDVSLECVINSPLKITVKDFIDHSVTIISDYIVQKSINSITDYEKIKNNIDRLKDTPYKINTLQITGDKNIFIPVSVINSIRRLAIEQLSDKRLFRNINHNKSDYSIDLLDYPKEQRKTILIHNMDEYHKIKNKNYDSIYIDDEDIYNQISDSRKMLKIERVLEKHLSYNQSLLIGELGALNLYSNVITDFSFNVVNSYTVAFLHSLGAKKVTLSYEMNDYQIKKLIDEYHRRYHKHPNLELIVDSRPEVMVCKYQLVPNNNDNNFLVDRFSNKYKIKIQNNKMYLYHYKKIILPNPNHYFDMGINAIRIEL